MEASYSVFTFYYFFLEKVSGEAVPETRDQRNRDAQDTIFDFIAGKLNDRYVNSSSTASSVFSLLSNAGPSTVSRNEEGGRICKKL